MSPIPMPWAMLKVSGMAKIVSTAGAAVSKSAMSISTTDCIMKIPTITSAGAVAHGGMARMSGVRKRARSMNTAAAEGRQPRAPARLDAGGGLDVADDGRGAAERAEKGGEGIGQERPARLREAARGVEQPGAFRHPDQRPDVVEHVDKEERQDERAARRGTPATSLSGNRR